MTTTTHHPTDAATLAAIPDLAEAFPSAGSVLVFRAVGGAGRDR